MANKDKKPSQNKKNLSKEEKIRRLKENLPLFWNSYQHMYDARERKAKGMIDFLLVVSTFLPILSVTLYTTKVFNNVLILIPIMPLIASIVILLKYFSVNTPAVHWFKLNEELLNGMKNGKFEIITISALKKLEGFTWISMNEESKIIRKSRILILSSLFLLIFSVLFILFEGNIFLYIFSILLITISYYVFFVYYRKRPDFSKEESEFAKNIELLNNWVNKDE